MNENEELIFGLKMWINKGISYLGEMDPESFFNDDKSFDACSYCLVIISDIAKEISKNKVICETYDELDFNELSKTYSSIFSGTNINLSLVYQLFKEGFPLLIKVLESKELPSANK